MHPHLGDLSQLTMSELEQKSADLYRRYAMTNNTSMQQQIMMLLSSYNEELRTRRQVEWGNAMAKTGSLNTLR